MSKLTIGKYYKHIKMLDAVLEVLTADPVDTGLQITCNWLLLRDTGPMFLARDNFVIKTEEFENWEECLK